MTHEMQTEEEVKDKDKENKEEEKMTTMKKNPLLPTVLWAQRRDRIFLTFEIKNAIRDSIQLEVRNPYPLEAMEEEEGKGAVFGYVGTSVVVFSCESLDVCGEEEEEKGILMIDDCSVETVGEKLKRQAFGGEDDEEEEASPTSVVDGQQRLRSPLSRERRRKKQTHKRTPSNWNFTTPSFPTKSRINSPSRIKPSTWFSSNQNQLRTGLGSSPRAKSSATSKPTLTAGKTKTKSWKTRTSSRSTRIRC